MNLLMDCDCEELSQENLINDFDCGDSDLNDFFNHDAILFKEQMLGQTHFFRHKETGKLVCCFIRFCAKKFPNLGRFLVVDAYNRPEVLNFYQKNDFLFLFTDEKQERDNLKKTINDTSPLRTRQMFYDMKRHE